MTRAGAGVLTRIRQARGSDRGFSLAELMVSVAVLSIVLAAVATVFVSSIRIVGTVRDRTLMTADARIGLEAITRTLRVGIRPDGEASAVTLASANALTFYTSINRSGTTNDQLPTKVEYSWDGNCLYEATTPARALSNPAATGPFYAWDTGRVNKCLLRTTVAPQFAYFTTAAISTAGVDNLALTVPAGGLVATVAATVQSVQVTLTVKSPGAGGSGTTVLDRVTLNNVTLDTGE